MGSERGSLYKFFDANKTQKIFKDNLVISEIKMSNKKRGISTIVVTLILVLLSIVAVGIVWVVINNILESSSGQINTGSACLEISVKATKVANTTAAGDIYDVTLKRTASGGNIGGVKLVLFNSTDNSGVVEFGDTLAVLESKTAEVNFLGPITDADKIEVTPYLAEDNGGTACSTTTFKF